MAPPAPQGPGASSTAAVNALCILTLLGVSIATYAYDRSLIPLYGTAPVQYHLNKVVWIVAIAATTCPALPVWPCVLAAGALLVAMPQTAYYAAVFTGRMGDPVWGPVMTHFAVIGPVMFLGSAVVKTLQINENSGGIFGAPVQAITLPVCHMAIMTLQPFWPLISLMRSVSEVDLLVGLGCIAIGLWAISSILPALPGSGAVPGSGGRLVKPPKKHYWRIAILPLLPYLLQYITAPTIPKPMLEPYLHPTAPSRILSSVESPFAGVVVVGEVLPPKEEIPGETTPHSLRYLRAGHSLLGGVWIGDRVSKKDGSGPVGWDAHATPIGDSIYSTFVTQEAARLVEFSDGRSAKNALIIGLGTGISASAFIEHGLSTTVVELDPAVIEAAKTYFGFKPTEPKKIHRSDARSFVSSQTRPEAFGPNAGKPKIPAETFDIVIHDVFSGGGVPAHLFTVGFWQDLVKIMKPDGVVAVVELCRKLLSDSGRAIAITLQSVFPQCRAYHEYNVLLSDEKLKDEFMNWIFFCTPSSTKELTFRSAKEADYLGSYLREAVLSSLPAHEVDLGVVTRELTEAQVKRHILTDDKNPLENWQDQEALHHWTVMRTVLPDVHWETY